jgi:uncharacterized protein
MFAKPQPIPSRIPGMKYTETVLTFQCGAVSLVGIIAAPEAASRTGVLVVVGGPQYRVGSHRQFVLLSRALAEAGYAVMCFDYSGMGDSGGEICGFEHVTEDIAAAIRTFREACPQFDQLVLWGLCDAASASLLYWDATHDPRSRGLFSSIPGFVPRLAWRRLILSIATANGFFRPISGVRY